MKKHIYLLAPWSNIFPVSSKDNWKYPVEESWLPFEVRYLPYGYYGESFNLYLLAAMRNTFLKNN
jgi:hypothetical protein